MDHLLEIHQLTKYFRSQWTFRASSALEDLSFTLRPGEIFGLIGHNGAGKTTTFKLLLGLLRPSRGRALFRGVPSHTTWARRQIGFLPEQPYFYDYLSVDEMLNFYGQLYRIPAADRARRIDDLIERLHLGGKRRTPIRSLSKGTLQRVGVAQAILHRPQLVILDEPMSGLDPAGRKEMRELIRSLKDEGTTVIFSSHILPDAEALCDRVGILAHGRLREVVDLAPCTQAPSLFSVTVSGVARANLEMLTRIAGGECRGEHDRWTLTITERERMWTVLHMVQESGGFLESLAPLGPSLEERFLFYVRGVDAAE